ncbi:hypothetical protein [Micromonospora chokoriensis]|uniref:hypothetical protein n=1 Tax=Micromonospora chokoriensis TaxID=356851 RepID=UPI0004C318A0|nr:hypothetical protein [Micromonospora chokoriensis]
MPSEHLANDEDRYLDVIDMLARRVDQLQSGSDVRHSTGVLALQSVVLFLSGGLAAGILNRLGERATDAAMEQVQAQASRRRRKDPHQQVTPDEAMAALTEVARLIAQYGVNMDETYREIREALNDLGYSEEASEDLARRISLRLHS